ncbi:hypothetical protein [Tabrizicola oligotrophica]|uniref:Uncharacterized protein n=1 Tax=Tabrizicola oligotrophica TaxID=2710650 RepID=A0A6M0QSU4_9RHOB|nr:hypothetical protein [Tabrizicola oligotrophica]NEY89713.1 hypothetical protein [Tabrizicola oligotrophica]
MLSLFADCLLVASRLPSPDARRRATLERKREDEEWLMQRRAGRFDATMR